MLLSSSISMVYTMKYCASRVTSCSWYEASVSVIDWWTSWRTQGSCHFHESEPLM